MTHIENPELNPKQPKINPTYRLSVPSVPDTHQSKILALLPLEADEGHGGNASEDLRRPRTPPPRVVSSVPEYVAAVIDLDASRRRRRFSPSPRPGAPTEVAVAGPDGLDTIKKGGRRARLGL